MMKKIIQSIFTLTLFAFISFLCVNTASAIAPPTSGWLNCDNSKSLEYYGDTNTTTTCNNQIDLISQSRTYNIYRIRFSFSDVPGAGSYPVTFDDDVYGYLIFGMHYTNSYGSTTPANFVGRNVEIIEYNFDTDDVASTMYLPSEIQLLHYFSSNYVLKVKIPKGSWDGTIDLQTNISLPADSGGRIYTLRIGTVRLGFVHAPDNSVATAVEDLKEQEQKNREQDQQNLQDAQNSADSDSESSASDASSTGTTLLAAFTSFVGAITSASPSNCKINMDMGNLNLGNVDLCTLSVPAPLQAIASIMLIAFCVPLSIATARKVIELFRSFQT